MLNNNKGFTLIELLVALLLMVILAGALYGTYFSVVSARQRGGARIDERRELSSTLGKLHNELASAFFNSANNAAKGGRLLFKVEDKDSFGKPASKLAFSTIAPPRLDPAPASGVILVQYFVSEGKEGKEGTLTLMREQREPYLDASVKSVPFPVMDVIDGFLVECYDGSKWVKSWDTDPALNGHLPKSVRVTLTTRKGEVFTTIAKVGMGQ